MSTKNNPFREEPTTGNGSTKIPQGTLLEEPTAPPAQRLLIMLLVGMMTMSFVNLGATAIQSLMSYCMGEPTVVEQAAKLDAWFADASEEDLVVVTMTDIGFNATTPIGEFCEHFCVVLDDGTLVARQLRSDGVKSAVVFSDYDAPEDWYGKAVVLDSQDASLALITDQTVYNYGEFSGEVWKWSVEDGAYVRYGTGSSEPRDDTIGTMSL